MVGMMLYMLLGSTIVFAANQQQIEVWGRFGSSTEWMQSTIFSKFTKETGVTVVYKDYYANPLDAYPLINDGKGPDVIMDQVLVFNSSKLVIPLDPLVQRWEDRRFFPQQFALRALLNANDMMGSASTGSIVALPLSIMVYGTSYFKPYFKQAGLDAEKPPASWEDLEIAASKLTQEGLMGRAGYDGDWGSSMFQTFLSQNNGRLCTEDYRWSLLTSQPVLQTLQFISRLFQASRPTTNPSFIYQKYKYPLNTAMEHLISYTSLKSNSGVANSFGVLPSKRCVTCKPAAYADGLFNMSIVNTSNKVDLAWRFISWMLSPEVSVTINSYLWYLSPRLDATDKVAKMQPMLVEWFKMIPYASPRDYIANALSPMQKFLRYNDETNDVYRKVLTGEIGADVVMQQLNGDYQQGLDDYYKKLHP